MCINNYYNTGKKKRNVVASLYFEYLPKHDLHNFFLSQSISINKQL